MSTARETLGLPAGTRVGTYRLEPVRGEWGFYLTYDAVDLASGSSVAVHELLPEELVTRADDGSLQARSEDAKQSMAWAGERFAREGRGLAACASPRTELILAVVEANGTVYWVTNPEQPRTFKNWLQELGREPREGELRDVLEKLLDGLQAVHAAGWPHLNIKPDTIRMTIDGPCLTHFAGARQAIARQCHEAAAVTTGYSPPEQYDLTKTEGTWTDIYGLAAVMHRAITGQAPPDAERRLGSDPYVRLAERCAGKYGDDFLRAIDAALAVDPVARPQSIEAWRRMLGIFAGKDLATSTRRRLAPLVAGTCVLAVVLWFVFRPEPAPNPPIKDETTLNEESQTPDPAEKKAEQKENEADVQKKLAEEQKKADEEKERLAAEQKAQQEQMAAEKDALAKAEQEKKAAEEAVRLAREAAEAVAKAEAASRSAEEAVQKAQAETDVARKAAAEKAAAQAAAEAAANKAAAEQAARIAEDARRAAENAAQAKAVAEKEAAAMIAHLEEGKRKAAEEAAGRTHETTAKPPAADLLAMEKAAAERAAAEGQRRAAEQAAQEKLATETGAAEKVAAEKRASEEKRVAEQAARNAAAEKEAAEKAAAEKTAKNSGDPNQGKYKQTTAEGSETNENTKGTTSVGSSGTGIPGIWETTATDAQGKPKRRLIIYDDGRYQISDNENWKDSGIILAKMGRIQMRSDASGVIVRSSFTLRSLSKIVTSGALGDEEWKRVSASPGDDPNAPKQ